MAIERIKCPVCGNSDMLHKIGGADSEYWSCECCDSKFAERLAKREYEKLYPGYDFTKARCLYNEVNGGWYIQARMRKRPERKRGRQCQTKI